LSTIVADDLAYLKRRYKVILLNVKAAEAFLIAQNLKVPGFVHFFSQSYLCSVSLCCM